MSTLQELGADATIRLDAPSQDLGEAFAREAGHSGFQVVIDYVWGRPAEVLLAAITSKEFAVVTSETRLVRAAVLRSTALTILGTAGIPPRNVLVEALQKVMAHAARGELHVDTERVPLADIENAWQRDQQGRRLVVIP